MSALNARAPKDWQRRLREVLPCVYACVGTDRSTGDSLGPLLGTLLSEAGVDYVFGTLSDPLHAGNLRERLPEIIRAAKEARRPILAIDAALGPFERIGAVSFGACPLAPGSGVGKDMPLFGDYSLVGTVNVSGFMEYVVLQNTSLGRVYAMAQEITGVIAPAHRAAREVAAAREARR